MGCVNVQAGRSRPLVSLGWCPFKACQTDQANQPPNPASSQIPSFTQTTSLWFQFPTWFLPPPPSCTDLTVDVPPLDSSYTYGPLSVVLDLRACSRAFEFARSLANPPGLPTHPPTYQTCTSLKERLHFLAGRDIFACIIPAIPLQPCSILGLAPNNPSWLASRG